MANGGPLPIDHRAPENPPPDFAASMPWWVRAIAIIGIPGVLVIYLVYIGAQEIPGIRRTTEQNGRDVLQNRDMIREQIQQNDALYHLLQRVCSNTAKSEDERARCFDR